MPSMLTRRQLWTATAASVFVLYAAGTTDTTWLTLVWMGWMVFMAQQWRAHRAAHRAALAQRGADLRWWRSRLGAQAAGPVERELAANMLAYLGGPVVQFDSLAEPAVGPRSGSGVSSAHVAVPAGSQLLTGGVVRGPRPELLRPVSVYEMWR
jgi:hypothetical protein